MVHGPHRAGFVTCNMRLTSIPVARQATITKKVVSSMTLVCAAWVRSRAEPENEGNDALP
jgi:hypothetical protein